MVKFIVGLALLLLVGCSKNEVPQEVKTCDWCDSAVHWHIIQHGYFTSEYQLHAVVEDGRYYHPWCLQIKNVIIEKGYNATDTY